MSTMTPSTGLSGGFIFKTTTQPQKTAKTSLACQRDTIRSRKGGSIGHNKRRQNTERIYEIGKGAETYTRHVNPSRNEKGFEHQR